MSLFLLLSFCTGLLVLIGPSTICSWRQTNALAPSLQRRRPTSHRGQPTAHGSSYGKAVHSPGGSGPAPLLHHSKGAVLVELILNNHCSPEHMIWSNECHSYADGEGPGRSDHEDWCHSCREKGSNISSDISCPSFSSSSCLSGPLLLEGGVSVPAGAGRYTWNKRPVEPLVKNLESALWGNVHPDVWFDFWFKQLQLTKVMIQLYRYKWMGGWEQGTWTLTPLKENMVFMCIFCW